MWNTCLLARSLSMGYTVFWHPTQVSFIGNWNFYRKKRKLVNWKMNQPLGDLAWVHAEFSEELQLFTFCNSLLITAERVLVGSEWGRGYGRIAAVWQPAKILPQCIPLLQHHNLNNGRERTMKIPELWLSQFPNSCLIYFCKVIFSW